MDTSPGGKWPGRGIRPDCTGVSMKLVLLAQGERDWDSWTADLTVSRCI